MRSDLGRTAKALLAAVCLVGLAACGSTVQLKPQAQAIDDGLGGARNVLGATDAAGDETLPAADAPGTDGAGTGGTGRGPAATSATTTARSADPLTTTGRGWDAKFVYIGVTTQKDVQQVAETAGLDGLNAGDQEGQANAIAAELNRRGGVFGRQIKIVFKDQQTTSTSQDPDTAGAAACHYFTEDRPVVAVLNPVTLMDVPSFRACLANAKMPLFSASVQPVDARVSQQLAPYFYQSVAPTWDALAPVLIRELQAQGWFGGWNTSNGSADNGKPVKIGILGGSDDVAARIENLVKQDLTAAGHADSIIYQYSGDDMSAAVLQFSGKGVTHVISIDSTLLAFMIPASSQRYSPRYSVVSYNAPATFLELSAPDAQLKGALGVGWTPYLDVGDSQDPGPTGPGGKDCFDWLRQGGQTFKNQRLGMAVGAAFCDGLRLITEGSTAGGGFTGPQVARGMQIIAKTFSTGLGFSTGLTPSRLFIPGSVRRLAYDQGCACFKYANATNLPL